MHNPKVSIVTISYNQCRFLERTIQSVLAQDYPQIEYIVVDPGSTDGSRELIESYRDRITRVIFEPDRGAADGLNKGFAAATGEILGFLNSDDVLYPNAVRRAVSFLEEHPDIVVVSGNAKVIDPEDRVLRLAYSDKFVLKRAAYGAVVLIQPSTRSSGVRPSGRVEALTWRTAQPGMVSCSRKWESRALDSGCAMGSGADIDCTPTALHRVLKCTTPVCSIDAEFSAKLWEGISEGWTITFRKATNCCAICSTCATRSSEFSKGRSMEGKSEICG